jgi:hypothetical protein
MGKTALTNSSIENQSYFQEHLRRTTQELFDWHLTLYGFWLSNSLPVKKFTKQFIVTKCNAEFRKNYSEMLEGIIQEKGQDRMFFPENAGKEYAIKYYLKNCESRDYTNLERKDSVTTKFLRMRHPSTAAGDQAQSDEVADALRSQKRLYHLSDEARCLSVIYSNFSEYRTKLKLDAWHFESVINSLMKDVIGDANALIGYQRLKYERKKAGRKGGKAPKRLPGILFATEKLLQDNRKKYSAERLWKYFETTYKGEENALKVKNFKVYFDYKNTSSDEERLFQISRSGIIKSIGQSAFNGYVKEAKNKSEIIYK